MEQLSDVLPDNENIAEEIKWLRKIEAAAKRLRNLLRPPTVDELVHNRIEADDNDEPYGDEAPFYAVIAEDRSRANAIEALLLSDKVREKSYRALNAMATRAATLAKARGRKLPGRRQPNRWLQAIVIQLGKFYTDIGGKVVRPSSRGGAHGAFFDFVKAFLHAFNVTRPDPGNGSIEAAIRNVKHRFEA